MFSKNKKGFVSVFIAMIIVSLISSIFIFIESSKEKAIGSAVLSLEHMWGDSILGEYDLNLKERYGLLGFYGTYNTTTAKLEKMAEYSLADKKYINYRGGSCELYDYALTGKNVFKEQIVEAAKHDFSKKYNDDGSEDKLQSDRIIENERIIKSLPSSEYDFGFDIGDFTSRIKNIKSMEDILKEGTSSYYTLKYIENNFKNASDDKQLGKTFFSNEMEYIVCGKFSDKKNEKSIRNLIIAVREILNLKYLNSDPEKSAILMAAAEVLTPGPGAVATKQALAGAWAMAESINDYKLLVNGKPVEFIKTKASWAIDLDSVLNNDADKYVDTGHDMGNHYDDYLRCFLTIMNEDKMLVRTMDLIQINMKFLYYGDFLLREYNVGCDMKIYANGKDYKFTAKY